jgi:tripartite-type tricarboxylate transporter receptor subunit TctC
VPSLPEVPTVAESGVAGYDVVYWYGIFVPAGTPKAAVGRLADEIAQSLRQKDVIANLANQGAAPGDMTQVEFAQFVRSEHARWTQVVKSSGAKAD